MDRDVVIVGAGVVGTAIARELTGALLVAWDDEQRAELLGIVERSRANGYDPIRELDVAELYEREPHLGPGAVAALEVPDEALVCPFTTPLAFATEAVLAGCELRRSTPVTGVQRVPGGFEVQTPDGTLTAGRLVNAAGLGSDEIDRMLGGDSFTVTPRRGELVVFDKLSRPLVRHILLAVPTKVSKGVLVSPTVFGNLMVGPTADDVERKDDTSSTAAGLSHLRREAGRIVPALLGYDVTAVYVGLRAATEHADFQIRFDDGYACVGGIRSTGLSASMAIAEYVRDGLELSLGSPREASSFRMPNLGEATPRPFQRGDLIEEDAEYGRVVCFCERVTRGELRDAMASPVPPVDLDGLRRRTRAHMGRCQGFWCGAHLTALLE